MDFKSDSDLLRTLIDHLPDCFIYVKDAQSRFIFTFGSTSLYELWSAGVRNAYVCNFVGPTRSRKYRFFESIFIDSYEDYLELIRNQDFQPDNLDALTAQVSDAYHDLFSGCIAQTACQSILNELES